MTTKAVSITVCRLVSGTPRPVRRWHNGTKWLIDTITPEEYTAGISTLPPPASFTGTSEEWQSVIGAGRLCGEIRGPFDTADGEPIAGSAWAADNGVVLIFEGGDRAWGGLRLFPGDYTGTLPMITEAHPLPEPWAIHDGVVTMPDRSAP